MRGSCDISNVTYTTVVAVIMKAEKTSHFHISVKSILRCLLEVLTRGAMGPHQAISH